MSALAGNRTSLEVPLNGFVDYLSTRGATRVSVAERHVKQSHEPYSPARDFYRRILVAIIAGRRSNNDKAVLNEALMNAPQSRKIHYQNIVDNWLKFLPQLTETDHVPVQTGRWRGKNLTVRVTPHLGVRHSDGRVEAYLLYLRAEPLSSADAAAMLWLANAAMPEACPGATPIVLDVRRKRVFSILPNGKGFGVWLHAEAGSYRQLRLHLDDE